MLIDWFTVGAQVLNFLILMALLKLFLYDRVIQAMDAREEKIAARLEDAEQQQRMAEEDRKEAASQRESFEAKREKLLKEAREDARSKREELESTARTQVDQLKARWQEALQDEKERLARDLEDQAVRHALAIARRVVADMADEDFQERLVATFAKRLGNLDEAHKRDLADSLEAEAPQAAILSALKLTTAQRQKLTRLLHEEIHPDLEVAYREDEALLGGIVLHVAGTKVAWSPRRYVEDLEEDVFRRLTAKSHPAASQEDLKEEDQEAEAQHDG